MKKILFIYIFIFLVFGSMPLHVLAQEVEPLTEDEKNMQKHFDDHGMEAFYEIFYIHRLLLSNDYSNFQDESDKLESLKESFKKRTGVSFNTRGCLLAPDFWPRVFRRDVSHADQFPAIEYYFTLTEIGDNYELEIVADLLKAKDVTGGVIGCLTEQRLDELESYINKKYLGTKRVYADDDETILFLNTIYDDLFSKLEFLVHPSISDKEVCIDKEIDLGDDLINLTLDKSKQPTFHWKVNGKEEFEGLVWKTPLSGPTDYTLEIKDPSGTCEQHVTVSVMDDCENGFKQKPSVNVVTCTHPVTNKKIIVDPGEDQIAEALKEIKLGGSPTAAYEDNSTPQFFYSWKLNGIEVSKEDNPELLLSDGGEKFTYELTVQDNSQKVANSESGFFECSATVEISVEFKYGPSTCVNPVTKNTLVVSPGKNVNVCEGTEVELKGTAMYLDGTTGNFKYTWKSENKIKDPNALKTSLTAISADAVSLIVEEVGGTGDEPFTCSASFSLAIERNYTPYFQITKDGKPIIDWTEMEFDGKSPISICKDINKLNLKIEKNLSSECANGQDLSALSWSLLNHQTQKTTKATGTEASFPINADTRDHATIQLNSGGATIGNQEIYRLSAQAFQLNGADVKSTFGFDGDKLRDGYAKYVSIKTSSTEKLKIILEPKEAADEVDFASNNSDLIINKNGLRSSNSVVEITAPRQEVKDGIEVKLTPLKTTSCNNLLSLNVYPLDELYGCLNIIRIGDDVTDGLVKDIESNLNTKVFNQAVINWTVGRQLNSIEIPESKSEDVLDLTGFPNVVSSDVQTITAQTEQTGCGMYVVYLVNKPLKTNQSGDNFAFYRMDDYMENGKSKLKADLVFINVQGYATSDKILKLISYCLAELIGLSNVQDYNGGMYRNDTKNLMNFSGDGLQLRYNQWLELREKIKKINFQPKEEKEPDPIDGFTTTEENVTSCPDYQGFEVGIKYKYKVDLHGDGTVPLNEIFGYQIKPKSGPFVKVGETIQANTQIVQLKPTQKFALVDLKILGPRRPYNLNLLGESAYQTTVIGVEQENNLEAKESGIYKYTIKLPGNYSCSALTDVVVPYQDFKRALANRKRQDLAKIVATRFNAEDFEMVNGDDRIAAIELMAENVDMFHEADGDEEVAINNLISTTHDEDAKSLSEALCKNNLIWTLRKKLDGDNYTQFIQSLKSLSFKLYGRDRLASLLGKNYTKDYLTYYPQREDEIKVFPWGDVSLNGSMYTPSYDDFLKYGGCNLNIRYSLVGAGMPYAIDMHPLDMIAIQFGDGFHKLNIAPGDVWIGPAISLVFLLDKEYERNIYIGLQAVAVVATLGSAATAEGALYITLGVLEVTMETANLAVLVFEEEIAAFHSGKGKDFLEEWNKAQLIISAIQFGSMVTGFPKLLEKINTKWSAVKNDEALFKALSAHPEKIKQVETFIAKSESYLKSSQVGPSLVRLGDDDALRLAEKWLTVRKASGGKTLDLLIHGGENNFRVFHNGTWVDLTHRDLANFLQSTYNLDNFDKVRLLSCNAGTIESRLAQNFSNKIKKNVEAADGIVWVHADGKISVGAKGEKGAMYLYEPLDNLPEGEIRGKKIIVEGSDVEEAVPMNNTGGTIPPSASTIKLGNKLPESANGVHKDIYELADDPNKLIAILKDGAPLVTIDKEFKSLQELANKGFPVIQVFEKTTYEGKPAMIMKKYIAESSKEVSYAKQSKYLNEKSIKDLKAIREKLIKENMDVQDLQFLITDDGTVLIHDPLYLKSSNPPGAQSLGHIDDLIDVAKQNALSKIPTEISSHAIFKTLSDDQVFELAAELDKYPALTTALKAKPNLLETWQSVKYLQSERMKPEFLEALDLTNRSTDMQHHIFHGDIGNIPIEGSEGMVQYGGSGVHAKSAIDNGYARYRPEESFNRFSDGTYEVKVDLKDKDGSWVPKVGNASTFFPDAWDHQHILEEISYAWTNKAKLSGKSYRGTSKAGFFVQFLTENNNPSVMISAYPRH